MSNKPGCPRIHAGEDVTKRIIKRTKPKKASWSLKCEAKGCKSTEFRVFTTNEYHFSVIAPGRFDVYKDDERADPNTFAVHCMHCGAEVDDIKKGKTVLDYIWRNS